MCSYVETLTYPHYQYLESSASLVQSLVCPLLVKGHSAEDGNERKRQTHNGDSEKEENYSQKIVGLDITEPDCKNICVHLLRVLISGNPCTIQSSSGYYQCPVSSSSHILVSHILLLLISSRNSKSHSAFSSTCPPPLSTLLYSDSVPWFLPM